MTNTQARILLCMQMNNNGLTVKEAMKYCGTTELRSNISKLKKLGYTFTDIREPHEGGSHKRYFLKGEPNG